ncbi:MAG: ATPase [Gemmataceae bacterium]|nr:ATPase [Gemmata sp.]MDW8198130.1 ATPase [Gemmataceae bacterium]
MPLHQPVAVAEWETNPAPEAPVSPESLKESGLSLGFVCDMILRTVYTRGAMIGRDLSQFLCLPFKVIREPLKFLKDEKLLQVDGGDLVGEVSYRFSLTDLGRERAKAAMEQCAYVGPAPVPLEDYVEQCYRQTVTGLVCYPEVLKAPFSHLVLKEEMFNNLGPAIISGKSVFIYGPPGNGKTAMARAIGDFMNTAGGSIYVPYAFLADSNIITVYDPSLHVIDDTADDYADDADATVRKLLSHGAVDQRWVRIRRPVIVTGGELNLQMLDLKYNAEAKFYQAPIHFKANGGVFLIDDFGRQLVSPKDLLNRWILPLEDRHDFLTVASGKKFQVPFEQLIIFSTNLDPKALVDDAFLRRIRHKVGVSAPTREVYERIFAANCKRLGMNYDQSAVDYLYERYYSRGRTPRASDCRDLLETVQSICRYRRQPVHLTRDLIAEAAASFIAEFT